MDVAEVVCGAAVDGSAFDVEDIGAGRDGPRFGLIPVPVRRRRDWVFPAGGLVVAEGRVHVF